MNVQVSCLLTDVIRIKKKKKNTSRRVFFKKENLALWLEPLIFRAQNTLS